MNRSLGRKIKTDIRLKGIQSLGQGRLCSGTDGRFACERPTTSFDQLIFWDRTRTSNEQHCHEYYIAIRSRIRNDIGLE